jgi:putative tricarboxylic transport membrane protein
MSVGRVLRARATADARGRHTTTARSLHLPWTGAWLIDTPGMRALGLADAAGGMRAVFENLAELARRCRFADCRVEAGAVDLARLARWRKRRRRTRQVSLSAIAATAPSAVWRGTCSPPSPAAATAGESRRAGVDCPRRARPPRFKCDSVTTGAPRRAPKEGTAMKPIGLAALLLAAALPAWAADYAIMAPASPGGGWDQTARTMQAALQEEGLSESVQVTNVPGAGGTIGLAQFVNQAKGDPSQLIVGGYVMVGAILTNQSPVDLSMVTPIARLTGEQLAIVAPAGGPIQSMDDLITALKADPGAVSWAGGSAGGADHIAAGLIAKAVGVDPTKVNYVAFSGGGEALAAILGGQVSVGVSGLGEFASQIEAGQLKLLATSGEARVEGFDAPTLTEAGVDVTMENWRMVAAAPELTDEQKAAITADIETMAGSATWQAALAERGWQDRFLAGDAFQAQLAADIEATGAILKDIGLVQ